MLGAFSFRDYNFNFNRGEAEFELQDTGVWSSSHAWKITWREVLEGDAVVVTDVGVNDYQTWNRIDPAIVVMQIGV